MSGRFLQFSRNLSSTRRLRASLAGPFEGEVKSRENESIKLWRRLFYFVCCPAILVGSINVYLGEETKRPEFIPYSHLRIRNNKYPWRDGVKTLFHNPHMNALPDGYENVEGHH